jgi:anti-sigma B factor antagonist
MTNLTVKTTLIEDGFRVALTGDVGAFQFDILDAEVDRLAAANPKRVAFDLSGVTYISSAGLGAFVKLRTALAKHGGQLLIGGAAPEIAKAFKRSKLDRLLTFVDSV